MKRNFFKGAIKFHLAVALTIAFGGMVLISSCGGTTSVSDREAYDAGVTIGRMLRGD